MPPASSRPSLHLQLQPKPFFVVKLPVNDPIPRWVLGDLAGDSEFFSATRTKDEISIVGESRPGIPDECKAMSNWSCIKIIGPLEHDLTGVMVDLATPLKAARVPIFAISTWNTDYILVPSERLSDAVFALRGDGWTFADQI